MPNYTRIPIEQRLWSRVNKTESCWLWTGWTEHTGYGMTTRGGSGSAKVAVHRVAYELTHGPIPSGYEVDHMCRTKICVNPDHLRLATRKQNQENLPPNSANTSGHRGVSWCASRQKWEAKVQHYGRTVHAGRFVRLEDAVSAAQALRAELFTHHIEY